MARFSVYVSFSGSAAIMSSRGFSGHWSRTASASPDPSRSVANRYIPRIS